MTDESIPPPHLSTSTDVEHDEADNFNNDRSPSMTDIESPVDGVDSVRNEQVEGGGAAEASSTPETTTTTAAAAAATLTSTTTQCTDDDIDDDDVTVILLDPSSDNSNRNNEPQLNVFDWIEQSGAPEIEHRRRNILLRELRRAQKSSFVQFLLLCMIPTVLLLVVIGTVLGDTEECASTETTFCAMEERTFMNAFTTRCICESIEVPRTDDP